MTRDDILATIRANEARLRELSVRELALFGSFVRGDATDASDIDFLVEFDETTLANYLDTKQLLESLFGRKVDLGRKCNIKPRLRERVLSEAVRRCDQKRSRVLAANQRFWKKSSCRAEEATRNARGSNRTRGPIRGLSQSQDSQGASSLPSSLP